ncbi:2-dehydro-3-deoxy-phosphogluconate aldolase [Lacticaseibacillus paracasei]|uniref:2-dehydro-3-deoxy-phosphogluconate aldolase n=1 Tax=Lacticaseibacillus paracasei TaxID=1597 RepID=UPI0021C3E584|nr:KDGP aldolase family protein [Lacticaseibacillus paracasei]MCP9309500.1 KDGP aldolase family protein [Lacticaseibacillus paracasei]MCP9346173.1 KDGP aldolase family protein [Lacticaseibacillus paracasei]MCP9365856.1 KDGP aldolase family protein [Lacticaseibacillus paracasei]MCP9378147.1 KDGP aldolase family protein [Lacticaseibacillus paracasei]
MNLTPNYYKNRVALNVLAGSIQNAEDIYQAAEGHVVVGVLTKNYDTDKAAIEDMKKYQAVTQNGLSVGLGAGDPNQSAMVSRVSKVLQPQHVNQVFTGVGTSRALLGQNDTVINGLVSPTGKVGIVNVATGPKSSQKAAAEVPVATAIALLQDMGGTSFKFFPMGGLKHEEEFRAVAKACAAEGFNLEPTGGIDLDNFEAILQIALDAGVKQIIPHIYSSIIDKATGLTRPEDVAKLWAITKRLVDATDLVTAE